MNDAALLDGLESLIDSDYGRIYIEWGGFRTAREVMHSDEGGWMFSDAIHPHNFHCASLREALGYMLEPPTEAAWEENIIHYHGPVSPGATLQGEHP